MSPHQKRSKEKSGKLRGKYQELSTQARFLFTNSEWQDICSEYAFVKDARGRTGFARMFITNAVSIYCRDFVLEIRQSEVKNTLKTIVKAFSRIQPAIDELEEMNNWKQAHTSFSLLSDGLSGHNLFAERFEEYRNFVQLIEGCLAEMPKVKTGPSDSSLRLLLSELEKAIKALAIDASLSPKDMRWKGAKANQRFLAIILKAAHRVTSLTVPDARVEGELHRYITKVNTNK